MLAVAEDFCVVAKARLVISTGKYTIIPEFPEAFIYYLGGNLLSNLPMPIQVHLSHFFSAQS